MEVILSKALYDVIVQRFEHALTDLETDLLALKKLESDLITNYNLPQRVVASIIAINYVKKMRSSHYRLTRLAPKLWKRYQESVAEGQPLGIVMKMARKENTAPALFAKLILEQYHSQRIDQKKTKPDSEDEKSVSSQEEVKSKSSIPGEGKNIVSKLIRDSSLITDGRLAKELLLAIYCDEQYGPISEMYNRAIGEEYEQLLYKKAQEASLSFQSENDLRSKGYDKTPDLKLNVPIAVDGFVVNWIESKGLFGDQAGHRSYISEQYSSYWNRFGPGLVIYWLGYEDSITDVQEKRFIVRASFPTNIVYMNPLSLMLE